MAEQTFDIRIVVDNEYETAENMMQIIGDQIDGVKEAVVLENDGFGNIVPAEHTRMRFP